MDHYIEKQQLMPKLKKPLLIDDFNIEPITDDGAHNANRSELWRQVVVKAIGAGTQHDYAESADQIVLEYDKRFVS